ncbi:hypothetical protein [Polaribacter sp. Z022]|uniref:hypothetical protein n=1 Tax=Polaribacter sp. Z022 TaxID=2927125 RepID=UPI002020B1C9|nr:hypothetical protein [Polaribacter sp. Z022]MCL7752995.1 hypothetical protein [Polaribacter sp. Z022]
MQIEKRDNYTLILSETSSFTEFYNSFLIEEKKHIDNNIVIQFSDNINITTEDYLLFLNISVTKKQNGTSFVIISSDIDIDDFPENLNIVPTLQEAEDVIEMEDIERDLGF